MTKVEIAEYEKTIAQLQRCLEKYQRKIFKLKQPSFTNNQMVTRFYRNAETDIKDAMHNIKHGYELHKHYIIENKLKQIK